MSSDAVQTKQSPTTSHFEINLTLKTLFTLAQESINSIPFNLVPRHWLRLYTDTSLLLSLSDLIFDDDTNVGKRRKVWLDFVRRLDMAIIVAGALGEKRAEWIQDTIKEIQRTKLGHRISNSSDEERPTKRARVKISTPAIDASSSTTLMYAPNPIPVLGTPPSLTRYLTHHIDHPFILRGHLTESWSASKKWQSAKYLLDQAGEGRVVPVEIGRAYDDEEWGQKIIPFKEFLRRAGFDVQDDDDVVHAGDEGKLTKQRERLRDEESVEDEGGADEDDSGHSTEAHGSKTPPLYLAQYGLFDQFPELARDISYPDYVWSEPPIPVDVPSYSPPQTEDGVIVNVWIGSGGSEIVSPAHTDPYYNCYAQVLGQKRVWLAPPSCGPYMHAYGSGQTNPGAEDDQNRSEINLDQNYTDNDENTSGLAEKYMTNTSKVPILRPLPREHSDFQSLIQGEFPDYHEHVWPVSLEAVLQPGDLMVMPPGWWHAMRGEGDGPGWSVSMWY
nr:uncharacterized protein CI109_000329 [Kwoniella shandongensis]KAA5531487.1 hypothetical protein CI109_000329 [Kwoniella shandongensis]